jgi:hypothetical protein
VPGNCAGHAGKVEPLQDEAVIDALGTGGSDPLRHTLTYPNQLKVGAAYTLPLPTPWNQASSLLFAFDWTWERFHV